MTKEEKKVDEIVADMLDLKRLLTEDATESDYRHADVYTSNIIDDMYKVLNSIRNRADRT